MEESLWLYFGVIAVLIGIVIVAQLVGFNVDREKRLALEGSINQMANFCDFICLSDLNQLLSQKVTLASGAKLYSTDLNGLCYRYEEKQNCRPCKCAIFDTPFDPQTKANFLLDLNTQQLKDLYATHEFSCLFFREREGVTLECTG